MIVDAVILAGGRSTRLGGQPKARLVFEGESLLARTVRTAAPARRLTVVGEVDALDPLPPGVLVGREFPPFGGPAAGITAGLSMLRNARQVAAEPAADFMLILACDLPRADLLVPVLLAALTTALVGPTTDGVIATDSAGQLQYLAGVYRTSALEAVVAADPDAARNRSVRSLLAGLTLVAVAVPAGTTDDVDTWDDAARFGIHSPHGDPPERTPQEQGVTP